MFLRSKMEYLKKLPSVSSATLKGNPKFIEFAKQLNNL